MAKYIILLNWTDQGAKAAKDTIKRAKAAAGAFEKMGAKLLNSYWTLGQHDLVLIAEAPDDEAITALGLQVGALGNVKTCTLRAFDEKDMEGILKRI